MELSWLMRLRITAAIAAGVLLIGLLAWPMAAPPDAYSIVSMAAISLKSKIVLVALASVTGLLAYFLSWPYGREISVIAVPSGLAFWAVRSGSIADVIQTSPALEQRQAILAAFKWEPLFWLIVVAAGFLGVLIGQKLSSQVSPEPKKADSKINTYLSDAIALVGSILIIQFCLPIFAQDIIMPDSRLGSVFAQPYAGQIIFAVLVSFGLAGFIFKKFLGVSYIWPAIAAGFITAFAYTIYVRQNILQYLVGHWPAVFLPSVILSILPIQMVAFGTLGSIVGYWLAVRYNYWKEHEM